MEIWNSPVELSKSEQFVCREAPRLRVLREHRHRIFDAEMQGKLHAASKRAECVPPAQLGLAMLLQAALDIPDHELVEFVG